MVLKTTNNATAFKDLENTDISAPLHKKNALTLFLLILRELQKIDPEFPLQYAVCLGIIAMDEGLSITDLSERSGLSLSTVSRIVGALSHKRQAGQAYDVVKVKISATERRRKELTLSTKGRILVESIERLLDSRSEC